MKRSITPAGFSEIQTAPLGLFSQFLQFQIVDDFSDRTIDSSIWNRSTPFGQSAVFEEAGSAVLITRGGLQTVSDLPDAIEISGRFRLTHPLDNIKIAFRSDLTTTSSFAELSGLIVEFNAGGGTFIAHGGGGPLEVADHVFGTFSSPLNTFHDFRIVDDGFDRQVFLDGASTPLTWGATTHRAGEKLAFYNREFSGLRAELDFVNIAAVPDSSSSFSLLLGCLGVLISSKHIVSKRVICDNKDQQSTVTHPQSC